MTNSLKPGDIVYFRMEKHDSYLFLYGHIAVVNPLYLKRRGLIYEYVIVELITCKNVSSASMFTRDLLVGRSDEDFGDIFSWKSMASDKYMVMQKREAKKFNLNIKDL